MKVPVEYRGREQTFLKHRVLSEYLRSWAHKMASLAGRPSYLGGTGEIRLWYVDCFAGPWQAQDEGLDDTSVAIGLKALEQAASTWSEKGYSIKLSAIFVEKDKRAFEKLENFLAKRSGAIECHPLPGAFGDFIEDINRLVGKDPAFLFVDPTGWKGVGMGFIAPLARVPRRDVLINVMFNHINRFKDDPRAFLRAQMKEFFGLSEGDIPAGLGEEELFAFYRQQLRKESGVRFAADLVIPHATRDRTWFRLVVGGHHQAVVELFRHVERQICGAEANEVREEARSRDAAQLGLGLDIEQEDIAYLRLHQMGLQYAEDDVFEMLKEHASLQFNEFWPQVLCERHITKTELSQVIWKLVKQGRLKVEPAYSGKRSIKDEDIIALPVAQ